MRRYIGYALIAVALLSLLVWAVNQFILPILPPNINNLLIPFFSILVIVVAVLAGFKEIAELFHSLRKKPSQHEEGQLVGNLIIKGPVQIVHGNKTNVTVNINYLVQSGSIEKINMVKIQETGPQIDSYGVVPREAPTVPSQMIGRSTEIVALKRILFQQTHTLGIVGLTGMGGIGKTVLAAALANDPDVEKAFPDGTLWAYVERSRDFREILVHWIHVLNSSININYSESDIWSLWAIFHLTIQNRRMLIVLDGVDKDSIQHVQALTKEVGLNSKVLITSRVVNLPSVESLVSLDVLPEQEALMLIERELGRSLSNEEQIIAREIAFLSGYLPLALKLDMGYMKSSRISIGELRDRLRAQVGYSETLGLDEVRERVVSRVFDSTYSRLSASDQSRFRALAVFSTPFDIEAAASVWRVDTSDAQHTLAQFLRLALLNLSNGLYSMHPLLNAFARKLLQNASQDEQKEAQKAYGEYRNSLDN